MERYLNRSLGRGPRHAARDRRGDADDDLDARALRRGLIEPAQRPRARATTPDAASARRRRRRRARGSDRGGPRPSPTRSAASVNAPASSHRAAAPPERSACARPGADRDVARAEAGGQDLRAGRVRDLADPRPRDELGREGQPDAGGDPAGGDEPAIVRASMPRNRRGAGPCRLGRCCDRARSRLRRLRHARDRRRAGRRARRADTSAGLRATTSPCGRSGRPTWCSSRPAARRAALAVDGRHARRSISRWPRT